MPAVSTRPMARTGASQPAAPGSTPRRGSAGLAGALALAACAAPAFGRDKGEKKVMPTAVLGSTAVDPVLPKASEVKALSAIGERRAVVFSPDFTMPSNRVFWEKLGFLYVEDASWER